MRRTRLTSIGTGWGRAAAVGLALTFALGVTGRAAGSPEGDKRKQLLEQLGIDRPPPPKEPAPSEEPDPTPDEDEDEDESPPPPGPTEPDRDGGQDPAPGGEAPAAETRRVPYSGRVHSMLRKRCQSCHQAGASAASTRLVMSGELAADYRASRKLVDPKDPRGSVLVTKAIGKAHGGGTVLTRGSKDYEALVEWISTGANRGAGSKSAAAPVPPPAVPTPTPTAKPGPSEPAPTGKAGQRRRPSSGSGSGSKGTKDATAPLGEDGGAPEGVDGTTPEAPAASTSTPATAPGSTAPAAPAGPTIAYAPEIHERLRAKCGSCHAPGAIGGRGAFVLVGDASADYAATAGMVDRSAPAKSRLLTKGVGVEHGGGAVLTKESGDYRAILAWIEDGAAEVAAPASAPDELDPAAPVPTEPGLPPVDATTGASVPLPGDRLGDGTSLGPTPSRLPVSLPYGLRINGKFDFSYERRDWKNQPFQPGRDAFQTYHHFLFLSRSGADDPFGFNVELLTQAFYEFNARVAPKGKRFSLLFKAGKILVPFGPEPLFHKSYGGRSGFDQEILPTVWAQPGLAVAAHVDAGPIAISNDLYTVQGYGLRDADAVLNLQGDLSPLDDVRPTFGDRLGLSWRPLTAWYSLQLNPLGFDRLLFMQALDVELWRLPDVPVLEDLVLGVGAMRADVSGAGPGQDYYHFGSYATVGYYPWDFLYLQYRAGLRTTDNRRAVFFDDTRADERDRGSHNVSIVGRYRGLYAGLQIFWNLERANEQDDDYLRLTVGYEF